MPIKFRVLGGRAGFGGQGGGAEVGGRSADFILCAREFFELWFPTMVLEMGTHFAGGVCPQK